MPSLQGAVVLRSAAARWLAGDSAASNGQTVSGSGAEGGSPSLEKRCGRDGASESSTDRKQPDGQPLDARHLGRLRPQDWCVLDRGTKRSFRLATSASWRAPWGQAFPVVSPITIAPPKNVALHVRICVYHARQSFPTLHREVTLPWRLDQSAPLSPFP